MNESENNPFRSPQDISTPVVVGRETGGRIDFPFDSGHRRAMWAIWLLAAGMCLNVAGVGSSYLEVRLFTSVSEGGTIEPRDAESNDMRQGIIGIGQFAIMIGTAIAFLMWFHRAHRNLRALGVWHLKYSPGWAVWGFFIPILNLFRPYQVMKEVWRGSDPAPASVQARRFENVPVSPIVGCWWALFIVMSIAERASFRVSMSAKSLNELLAASWLDIACNIISMLAAIVTIFMIRIVDAHQEQRSLAISVSGRGKTEGNS